MRARVLRLQRAAVIPRGTARALGVSKNLQQILGQGINTQALKRRYASEKHRMKMHFVPPQCPPPQNKNGVGAQGKSAVTCCALGNPGD